MTFAKCARFHYTKMSVMVIWLLFHEIIVRTLLQIRHIVLPKHLDSLQLLVYAPRGMLHPSQSCHLHL